MADVSDAGSEPSTVAPDGEETTVVRSDVQTGAADLAWSVADTAPDFEAPVNGRRPLSKTLLAFLAGVGVAAIAMSAFVLGERVPEEVDTAPTSTAPLPTPSVAPVSPSGVAPQPTSATSVAPPVPAPAPPVPAPPAIEAPSPSVPQSVSPDDTFIARLQADGITFSNQAQALRVAREVCLEFALGVSEADIAAAVQADNPSLPENGAADLVGLSVNAYCPQYKRN
jgi:hypothetical protein